MVMNIITITTLLFELVLSYNSVWNEDNYIQTTPDELGVSGWSRAAVCPGLVVVITARCGWTASRCRSETSSVSWDPCSAAYSTLSNWSGPHLVRCGVMLRHSRIAGTYRTIVDCRRMVPLRVMWVLPWITVDALWEIVFLTTIYISYI